LKKASKEDAKIKPWTSIAKSKIKAEEEIKAVDGLNWVIVRPAIVYGIGDMTGVTPRIVVGAVYKELKEEMKLLWTKDLKINTVHVSDVVAALILICQNKDKSIKQIFNLADKSDADQDTINDILKKIFGISTGYQGTIISNLARLNLKDITEEINEKHLQPWSDLCKRLGVASSPLTPYLDQELLYNNSLAVDGTKIETVLGFKYSVPEVTEEKVREVINGFIEVGAFPKGFI
jgi:nucleoside-diphosphate-sugar epimerase